MNSNADSLSPLIFTVGLVAALFGTCNLTEEINTNYMDHKNEQIFNNGHVTYFYEGKEKGFVTTG